VVSILRCCIALTQLPFTVLQPTFHPKARHKASTPCKLQGNKLSMLLKLQNVKKNRGYRWLRPKSGRCLQNQICRLIEQEITVHSKEILASQTLMALVSGICVLLNHMGFTPCRKVGQPLLLGTTLLCSFAYTSSFNLMSMLVSPCPNPKISMRSLQSHSLEHGGASRK
jgi:hypothetical protein